MLRFWLRHNLNDQNDNEIPTTLQGVEGGKKMSPDLCTEVY